MKITYTTILQLSMFTSSLSAASITIPSLNNTFNLYETEDFPSNVVDIQAINTEKDHVIYYLDITTSQPVHAFGISFVNDLPFNEIPRAGVASLDFTNSTTSWTASIITKFSWDNESSFNIFTVGSTTYDTADLGTFEDLFGTTDDHVVFYNTPTPMTEANDTDQTNWGNPQLGNEFFFRTGEQIFSNAIIVGDSGNIIGGSLIAVPEPSTTLFTGLAGMLLFIRRKK